MRACDGWSQGKPLNPASHLKVKKEARIWGNTPVLGRAIYDLDLSAYLSIHQQSPCSTSDTRKNTSMAPIDVVNGDPEVSSIGDSKTSSNQIEDAESGTKRAQFNEERVVLTEQDVSPSSKSPPRD